MQRLFVLSLLCLSPILTGLAVVPSIDYSPTATSVSQPQSEVSSATVREEWLGVYQQDEKVGYLQRRLATTPSGYDWEEHWWLSLRLLDEVQTTHTEVHARADRACALTAFSLWSVGAGAAMYIKADIVNRGTPRQEVKGEAISNGETTPFTLALSHPLQLPPLCQMASPHSLRPGTSRDFSVFNPLSLRAEVVSLTSIGTEVINVDGRPQKVTKLVSELSDTSLYTWLDNSGRVIKEEIAPEIFLRQENPITARGGDWQKQGLAPHISTADLLDAPEEE